MNAVLGKISLVVDVKVKLRYEINEEEPNATNVYDDIVMASKKWRRMGTNKLIALQRFQWAGKKMVHI